LSRRHPLRAALTVAAIVSALVLGVSSAAWGAAPVLDSKAWVLVEARSGDELAGKDTTRQLPIASTTKLMTAYLALRELKLNQKIAAGRYRPTPGEITLRLRPGEQLTVRDLLLALMLPSANDAAVTLARGTAGSVQSFVDQMNKTALALGFADTHFSTPVGLDERGNYSSAHDLASLADRLLANREFAEVVDTPRAVLRSGNRPRPVVSRNELLLRYPWIDGVKTGHTANAGHVLVASAERKGVLLISVVLGASSEGARDSESLELLRYGFGLYRPQVPVKAGARIAAPKIRYTDDEMPLLASKDVKVGVREGQSVDTRIEVSDEVEGPIRSGQRLGTVDVTVDGRSAGGAKLIAAESEPAASGFQKFRSRFLRPVLLVPLGLLVILVGMTAGRRDKLRRHPRSHAERRQHRWERRREREVRENEQDTQGADQETDQEADQEAQHSKEEGPQE
jgi:D-alanyl-D-alanine carboxypeptidase (penicillin-binding protein 5/6)